MAGYSLQAGQLAGVLGSLNTISNTYQVTVKQMLDGLGRVAPLAQQAGIGLTELMGFEAVITGRTQRPGAEAGQALKSLIVRLNKPETQAALETAGISPTNRNGELKTASQLINELYLAYNRLGAAEREEGGRHLPGRAGGRAARRIHHQPITGRPGVAGSHEL